MKCSLKGNEMHECYISVDIEATGPTPGAYSMYELGACVVGESKIFESHIALLPDSKYAPTALRAVGTTKQALLCRSNALPPASVMSAFAEWAKCVARGKRLVFVANNAPFDWMFVAWYFEKCGVLNPFGHSAFDMKAYFMGMTGCMWRDATLDNMAIHANVEFGTLPHRALEDALIQSHVFEALMKQHSLNIIGPANKKVI